MDVTLMTSNLVLYVILIIAVIQDFKSLKVSNRLILTGLGLSLIFRFMTGGLQNLVWALPNIAFPVIVLYLFYLVHAIGAGDIKLFSVIGGFISFKELTGCIVWAFFIGAVLSLVKMLFDKNLKERLILGKSYVVSLLSGQIMAYPYKTKTSLIHFSLPILLGLIAVQYLGVWQF